MGKHWTDRVLASTEASLEAGRLKRMAEHQQYLADHAARQTGKSLETKTVPNSTRDGSRTGAFQGAVDEIAAKTPSSWRDVVNGAK